MGIDAAGGVHGGGGSAGGPQGRHQRERIITGGTRPELTFGGGGSGGSVAAQLRDRKRCCRRWRSGGRGTADGASGARSRSCWACPRGYAGSLRRAAGDTEPGTSKAR